MVGHLASSRPHNPIGGSSHKPLHWLRGALRPVLSRSLSWCAPRWPRSWCSPRCTPHCSQARAPRCADRFESGLVVLALVIGSQGLRP